MLQDCLASLDDGKHALTFASGLAATTAVIQLLKAGDHVLCGDDMYGGTNRYFSKIASKFGVKFTMTNMTKDDNIEQLILPETKVGQLRMCIGGCMYISAWIVPFKKEIFHVHVHLGKKKPIPGSLRPYKWNSIIFSFLSKEHFTFRWKKNC